MRTMLINPPYQTITSNQGVGHQVPLGLLMVGGALRDAGDHQQVTTLLDAEVERLTDDEIVERVRHADPDVLMTGHAGSTPAHPVTMRMLAAIKRAFPKLLCVYGGVYPTYHDEQVLRQHGQVDMVIRGEGEATAAALMKALQGNELAALSEVDGITFRDGERIVRNPDRASIADLNSYRTAWELVGNWDMYQCFGRGRAAIVQLSRGCPHRCTYCGQHSFWKRWRYRDPEALADEIQWLHDTHGIKFITLADENPTTRKDVWVRFLEAVARRAVDVQFFSTIRATDIVRDADVIELYYRAGLRYVLMGIDTTDPDVIKQIRKRSTTRHDFEACKLLRDNGIHSMIGHIVGLGDETWRGLRRAGRALRMYDGDYLNAMYATPHSWTAFAREHETRGVVQEDQQRWDYRHQILEEPHLRPWQLFAAVKWLELTFHFRPKRLWRMFFTRDRARRTQAWWNFRHTTAVWFAEIAEFVTQLRFTRRPRPLSQVIAASPDAS